MGAISSIIYIDPEKKDSILARLSNRDSSYALIVSKLTKEEANKIKESELQGIYIGEDNTRFYPEGDLASHVLGYFGETREGGKRGYYGLEHYFEDILAGKTGAARAIPSLGIGGDAVSVSGADIELTIDYTVQFTVEKRVRKSSKRNSSRVRKRYFYGP